MDLCALHWGPARFGAHRQFYATVRLVNTAHSNVPRHHWRSGGTNCSNPTARNDLSLHAVYVCPGGHRDRSLSSKCGYGSNYYCTLWGCETTGNGDWNPSSSWDFITVKRGLFQKILTVPAGVTHLLFLLPLRVESILGFIKLIGDSVYMCQALIQDFFFLLNSLKSLPSLSPLLLDQILFYILMKILCLRQAGSPLFFLP